jgi:NAD(P)-dependent dehydrogenase (short-subunit alcohol dehydrogenase family)
MLDILVNNAAEQYFKPVWRILLPSRWINFQHKLFLQLLFNQNVLPHLKSGSSIINAASLTAYEGNELLMDYSTTKGAIIAFTRSLSKSQLSKGICVNGVVPGTMWTPLIPASFPADQVANWEAKYANETGRTAF